MSKFRYRYVAKTLDGSLTMEAEDVGGLYEQLTMLRRLGEEPDAICDVIKMTPSEPLEIADQDGNPFIVVWDRRECSRESVERAFAAHSPRCDKQPGNSGAPTL